MILFRCLQNERAAEIKLESREYTGRHYACHGLRVRGLDSRPATCRYYCTKIQKYESESEDNQKNKSILRALRARHSAFQGSAFEVGRSGGLFQKETHSIMHGTCDHSIVVERRTQWIGPVCRESEKTAIVLYSITVAMTLQFDF